MTLPVLEDEEYGVTFIHLTEGSLHLVEDWNAMVPISGIHDSHSRHRLEIRGAPEIFKARNF